MSKNSQTNPHKVLILNTLLIPKIVLIFSIKNVY